MKEALLNALKLISERYNTYGIKWVIIGSTSLALQNVNVKPNDIDILTDKYGGLKSNELFREYLIKEVKRSKTKLYRSFFGKFKIYGHGLDCQTG